MAVQFDEEMGNPIWTNTWLVFLFCVALLCLKAPDAVLNPQFWAEDGSIFYGQQFASKSPLLFTPYAGYLHFIPRLIAWLASGVDPQRVPLVYNTSAVLADAACIAYAAGRMSPLFGLPIALGAFFLTPTVGDIFSTITNIQWIAQFALVFGVFETRLTRRYRLGDIFAAGLILAIALTGPFSVILAALIVLLWIVASLAGPDFALGLYGSLARGILSNIEPTRLTALFVGGGAQSLTMIANKLRTPEEFYTLSLQEKASFGWVDAQSSYLHTIARPTSRDQLILLVVYIVIFLICTIDLKYKPMHKVALIMTTMTFGFSQPLVAYLKQHKIHVLSASSHYYYFLGVIAFCYAAQKLLSIQSERRALAIGLAAAGFTLFFVINSHLLIRPMLKDMHWREYADRISAGETNILVPLNPGWRLLVNP